MSSKRFFGSLVSFGQTTKCEKTMLLNNDGDDCFVLEGVKKVQMFLGENMVKYIEKVDKEISSLKRGKFAQKHKKVYSNFT